MKLQFFLPVFLGAFFLFGGSAAALDFVLETRANGGTNERPDLEFDITVQAIQQNEVKGAFVFPKGTKTGAKKVLAVPLGAYSIRVSGFQILHNIKVEYDKSFDWDVRKNRIYEVPVKVPPWLGTKVDVELKLKTQTDKDGRRYEEPEGITWVDEMPEEAAREAGKIYVLKKHTANVTYPARPELNCMGIELKAGDGALQIPQGDAVIEFGGDEWLNKYSRMHLFKYQSQKLRLFIMPKKTNILRVVTGIYRKDGVWVPYGSLGIKVRNKETGETFEKVLPSIGRHIPQAVEWLGVKDLDGMPRQVRVLDKQNPYKMVLNDKTIEKKLLENRDYKERIVVNPEGDYHFKFIAKGPYERPVGEPAETIRIMAGPKPGLQIPTISTREAFTAPLAQVLGVKVRVENMGLIDRGRDAVVVAGAQWKGVPEDMELKKGKDGLYAYSGNGIDVPVKKSLGEDAPVAYEKRHVFGVDEKYRLKKPIIGATIKNGRKIFTEGEELVEAEKLWVVHMRDLPYPAEEERTIIINGRATGDKLILLDGHGAGANELLEFFIAGGEADFHIKKTNISTELKITDVRTRRTHIIPFYLDPGMGANVGSIIVDNILFIANMKWQPYDVKIAKVEMQKPADEMKGKMSFMIQSLSAGEDELDGDFEFRVKPGEWTVFDPAAAQGLPIWEFNVPAGLYEVEVSSENETFIGQREVFIKDFVVPRTIYAYMMFNHGVDLEQPHIEGGKWVMETVDYEKDKVENNQGHYVFQTTEKIYDIFKVLDGLNQVVVKKIIKEENKEEIIIHTTKFSHTPTELETRLKIDEVSYEWKDYDLSNYSEAKELPRVIDELGEQLRGEDEEWFKPVQVSRASSTREEMKDFEDEDFRIKLEIDAHRITPNPTTGNDNLVFGDRLDEALVKANNIVVPKDSLGETLSVERDLTDDYARLEHTYKEELSIPKLKGSSLSFLVHKRELPKIDLGAFLMETRTRPAKWVNETGDVQHFGIEKLVNDITEDDNFKILVTPMGDQAGDIPQVDIPQRELSGGDFPMTFHPGTYRFEMVSEEMEILCQAKTVKVGFGEFKYVGLSCRKAEDLSSIEELTATLELPEGGQLVELHVYSCSTNFRDEDLQWWRKDSVPGVMEKTAGAWRYALPITRLTRRNTSVLVYGKMQLTMPAKALQNLGVAGGRDETLTRQVMGELPEYRFYKQVFVKPEDKGAIIAPFADRVPRAVDFSFRDSLTDAYLKVDHALIKPRLFSWNHALRGVNQTNAGLVEHVKTYFEEPDRPFDVTGNDPFVAEQRIYTLLDGDYLLDLGSSEHFYLTKVAPFYVPTVSNDAEAVHYQSFRLIVPKSDTGASFFRFSEKPVLVRIKKDDLTAAEKLPIDITFSVNVAYREEIIARSKEKDGDGNPTEEAAAAGELTKALRTVKARYITDENGEVYPVVPYYGTSYDTDAGRLRTRLEEVYPHIDFRGNFLWKNAPHSFSVPLSDAMRAGKKEGVEYDIKTALATLPRGGQFGEFPYLMTVYSRAGGWEKEFPIIRKIGYVEDPAKYAVKNPPDYDVVYESDPLPLGAEYAHIATTRITQPEDDFLTKDMIDSTGGKAVFIFGYSSRYLDLEDRVYELRKAKPKVNAGLVLTTENGLITNTTEYGSHSGWAWASGLNVSFIPDEIWKYVKPILATTSETEEQIKSRLPTTLRPEDINSYKPFINKGGVGVSANFGFHITGNFPEIFSTVNSIDDLFSFYDNRNSRNRALYERVLADYEHFHDLYLKYKAGKLEEPKSCFEDLTWLLHTWIQNAALPSSWHEKGLIPTASRYELAATKEIFTAWLDMVFKEKMVVQVSKYNNYRYDLDGLSYENAVLVSNVSFCETSYNTLKTLWGSHRKSGYAEVGEDFITITDINNFFAAGLTPANFFYRNDEAKQLLRDTFHFSPAQPMGLWMEGDRSGVAAIGRWAADGVIYLGGSDLRVKTPHIPMPRASLQDRDPVPYSKFSDYIRDLYGVGKTLSVKDVEGVMEGYYLVLGLTGPANDPVRQFDKRLTIPYTSAVLDGYAPETHEPYLSNYYLEDYDWERNCWKREGPMSPVYDGNKRIYLDENKRQYGNMFFPVFRGKSVEGVYEYFAPRKALFTAQVYQSTSPGMTFELDWDSYDDIYPAATVQIYSGPNKVAEHTFAKAGEKQTGIKRMSFPFGYEKPEEYWTRGAEQPRHFIRFWSKSYVDKFVELPYEMMKQDTGSEMIIRYEIRDSALFLQAARDSGVVHFDKPITLKAYSSIGWQNRTRVPAFVFVVGPGEAVIGGPSGLYNTSRALLGVEGDYFCFDHTKSVLPPNPECGGLKAVALRVQAGTNFTEEKTIIVKDVPTTGKIVVVYGGDTFWNPELYGERPDVPVTLEEKKDIEAVQLSTDKGLAASGVTGSHRAVKAGAQWVTDFVAQAWTGKTMLRNAWTSLGSTAQGKKGLRKWYRKLVVYDKNTLEVRRHIWVEDATPVRLPGYLQPISYDTDEELANLAAMKELEKDQAARVYAEAAGVAFEKEVTRDILVKYDIQAESAGGAFRLAPEYLLESALLGYTFSKSGLIGDLGLVGKKYFPKTTQFMGKGMNKFTVAVKTWRDANPFGWRLPLRVLYESVAAIPRNVSKVTQGWLIRRAIKSGVTDEADATAFLRIYGHMKTALKNPGPEADDLFSLMKNGIPADKLPWWRRRRFDILEMKNSDEAYAGSLSKLIAAGDERAKAFARKFRDLYQPGALTWRNHDQFKRFTNEENVYLKDLLRRLNPGDERFAELAAGTPLSQVHASAARAVEAFAYESEENAMTLIGLFRSERTALSRLSAPGKYEAKLESLEIFENFRSVGLHEGYELYGNTEAAQTFRAAFFRYLKLVDEMGAEVPPDNIGRFLSFEVSASRKGATLDIKLPDLNSQEEIVDTKKLCYFISVMEKTKGAMTWRSADGMIDWCYANWLPKLLGAMVPSVMGEPRAFVTGEPVNHGNMGVMDLPAGFSAAVWQNWCRVSGQDPALLDFATWKAHWSDGSIAGITGIPSWKLFGQMADATKLTFIDNPVEVQGIVQKYENIDKPQGVNMFSYTNLHALFAKNVAPPKFTGDSGVHWGAEFTNRTEDVIKVRQKQRLFRGPHTEKFTEQMKNGQFRNIERVVDGPYSTDWIGTIKVMVDAPNHHQAAFSYTIKNDEYNYHASGAKVLHLRPRLTYENFKEYKDLSEYVGHLGITMAWAEWFSEVTWAPENEWWYQAGDGEIRNLVDAASKGIRYSANFAANFGASGLQHDESFVMGEN